jgi:uncharacterized protein (DUF983 family)
MATPARNSPSTSTTTPSKATILLRGMALRCGRCGQGGLFHHWTEMADACPKCGLHFEQEEGYWTGALVINTMVALTLFSILIGVMVGVTWPNIPVFTTMAVGVVAGIVFPYFFYPISKTSWVALDLAYFHPELMKPGTGLLPKR